MFSLTIHLSGGKTEHLDMMPAEVPDSSQQGQVLEIPAFTAIGSDLASPLPDGDEGEFDEWEDFPPRDDENWLKHTLALLDDDGHVRLDYRSVHLHPLSNETSSIPPNERVY